MGWGSFFSGLSQGLAEEQNRKNLLELQQDVETRKALAQHYLKRAEDPAERPEAQRVWHDKAIRIMQHPYTKKLPKDLSDISDAVMVNVPAQTPPPPAHFTYEGESFDVNNPFTMQRDFSGGLKPGRMSEEEQALRKNEDAYSRSVYSAYGQLPAEAEIAKIRARSAAAFQTAGRAGTVSAAQAKQMRAAGLPFDPASSALIDSVPGETLFAYAEDRSGATHLRITNEPQRGLFWGQRPGEESYVPLTRGGITGEAKEVGMPPGVGTVGPAYLTPRSTTTDQSTSENPLAQTTQKSTTAVSTPKPVVGGVSGPALTAPAAPPVPAPPQPMAQPAAQPAAAPPVAAPGVAAAPPPPTTISTTPLEGTSLKGITEQVGTQGRLQDSVAKTITAVPDIGDHLQKALGDVTTLSSAPDNSIDLSKEFPLAPSALFSVQLAKVKDPNVRSVIKDILDNPGIFLEMEPGVKTQFIREMSKVHIPIPSKASAESMNYMTNAFVSLQAIAEIENAILGNAYNTAMNFWQRNMGPIGGRLGHFEQWWGTGFRQTPVDLTLAQYLRTRLEYFKVIEAKVLMGSRPAWMWVKDFALATPRPEMDMAELVGAMDAARRHAISRYEDAARGLWGEARYREVIPSIEAPWVPGSPREGDMRLMPGRSAAIARMMPADASDPKGKPAGLYWVQEVPTGEKDADGTPLMARKRVRIIWPPKGVAMPR